MIQSSISKSEGGRLGGTKLMWKKNDEKAQKNGAHSNIYWVKVLERRSRNSPLTKTAPSRPTNGAALISTSETGRTTKRKASAYSTTPMETSTREDGTKTNATDRAPIGLQTTKTNSAESILETGKTTLNRAEAPCSTNLETATTACGWTICPMAKAG